MGTLSAKAFVQLQRQCIDYAREHRLGIFGVELSAELRERIDREWKELFGETDATSTSA